MLAAGGAAATTACFVAGTPVLLDTGIMIPIEEVRLGQVVASAPDPFLRGVPEETCLDGVSWREVHLQIDRPDGATTDAYLLRPDEWLDSVGAATGNVIMVDLPEMAVHGLACVCEIGPCPEIVRQADAGKSIVTGRFATSNAAVLDLFLDGCEEAIGTTAAHPFWSLDREGWVRAGDLYVGENVATKDGSANIEAIVPEKMRSTVYNLEIRGYHTYYVSDAKLWVHNNCWMTVTDALASVKTTPASLAVRVPATSADRLAEGWVWKVYVRAANGIKYSLFEDAQGYLAWLDVASDQISAP